jgi:ATP-dependent DNA helicase RecG
MADKVVDLVYLKYFKGIISYDGIYRKETYPVPRPAFREAVLNSIVHKDYSTGNPIHVHIYPDKVLIYNDGKLPDNWTVEDLFAPHTSKPYNPLIAGAFFRSGQIEAWGRGIEKIIEACKEWNTPEPFYRVRPNEVMIGFNTEPQFGEKFGEKFGENQTHERIQELMRQNPRISAKTIAEEIGITARGVEKCIRNMKATGTIERIGSAKGGHWIVNPPANNGN